MLAYFTLIKGASRGLSAAIDSFSASTSTPAGNCSINFCCPLFDIFSLWVLLKIFLYENINK